MTRALITGITGQDGRYLADLLHAKGYEVFGLVAGPPDGRDGLVEEPRSFVRLLRGDLRDGRSLVAALEVAQPDEVYNLAAVSSVALSFREPERTADVTGVGVLRLLEAVRMAGGGDGNRIRFYQASSSEMFGAARRSPQSEETAFHPRSPYALAKVFGYHATVNYREAYGLHASNGICFNHESPLRGPEYVTRKVTRSAARIKLGLQSEIVLGNLDARRDWGFAGDYVRAMWMMLQQPEPDDYVIATGETHSVRELVEQAFLAAGIEDWERYVRADDRFLRPADVDCLVGDPTKARTVLGWKAECSFEDLIRMMVESDLALERGGRR